MNCTKGATQPATGNWYPENFRRIEQIVKENNSVSTSNQIAVFDFDNTCIYRDIGQAVFRYQCSRFHYRLTVEQFQALLPSADLLLDGKALKKITSLLIARYTELSGENNKQETQKEFSILFQWFVQQARRHKQLGPRYVLPLLCQLFAGYSINEVKSFTREVITQVAKEPLEKATESLRIDTLGSIAVTYDKGLLPFAEIQTLMHWFTENKIRCFVISASTNWMVQQAVETFNYPVARDDIYGIRCCLQDETVLTTALPENYPITYRQGKAQIIDTYLHQSPLLVAGDADTDYEMLTLPGIPLRLIINRNYQGKIQSLYDHPDYLLQGVDKKSGQFRPHRETV